MLTPGELDRGLWIMVHSLPNNNDGAVWQDEQNQSDNSLMGLFMASAPKAPNDYPFLILGVELPYIVVANVIMNPYGTFIWDTREYNLMEVSPEFVRAYTPQGYEAGLRILQNTARATTK